MIRFNDSQSIDYVQVISNLGVIVQQEKISSNELNLANLSNGFYFIKVYFENGQSEILKVLLLI
ncbi:MAG: T9SS type A sorting domain-containing protein [Saprospiraceae bacterium]|nr:T9SS type A sorting domain-containing protein [Saprospiraceae bacterium]